MTDSTVRRFAGLERLYGPGTSARLAKTHVCVVGIGGVGSWAVEALVRSGVGRLTLIDLDHVVESNFNRQIHALDETLGMAKVQAMRARIAQINPHCRVTAIEEFVAPDNVAAILPACAAVIDAIDQRPAKAALLAHCRQQALPVVTTGGAGGRSDPTRIRISDLARTTHDPLCARLRASLRHEHGFPATGDFGIPCVYSTEPIRRADGADSCASGPQGAPLACAGYGSSVAVTAAFGLAAVSCLLARLLVVPV